MSDHLRLRVESLVIYPIKSCAGIQVPRLRFTAQGLIDGDREWVVVNEGGEVTWQGAHPRLALVAPALSGQRLVLRAPGVAPVEVPQRPSGPGRELRIWNDVDKVSEVHEGIDAGSRARAFLSKLTGADLSLVRLSAKAIARGSVNPVHVLSTSSLHELNDVLAARGGRHADTARFRPNVVLSGVDTPLLPFLEEHIVRLSWSPAEDAGELSVIGPCVRCIVPNVDPSTGAVADEPLGTVTELSAARHPGQPACFGVYARPAHAASLGEGQIVEAELSFVHVGRGADGNRRAGLVGGRIAHGADQTMANGACQGRDSVQACGGVVNAEEHR